MTERIWCISGETHAGASIARASRCRLSASLLGALALTIGASCVTGADPDSGLQLTSASFTGSSDEGSLSTFDAGSAMCGNGELEEGEFCEFGLSDGLVNAYCDDCEVRCVPGFADCDPDPLTCEADLASTTTCGTCDKTCLPSHECTEGECSGVVTLWDFEDAFVSSGAPSTNFGMEEQLLVDVYGCSGVPEVSGECRALMRPTNFGGLPEDATIHSAELRLDCLQGGGTVDVGIPQSDWSETTVTFLSAPNSNETIATFEPCEESSSINITPAVSGWLSGSLPNHGLLLTTESDYGSAHASSEAGIAGPLIRISASY